MVGLKLPFMCISGVKNRGYDENCKKHDSLGTILFDLKETLPFSRVGQNARTKSALFFVIRTLNVGLRCSPFT